jgi:hypothetical protein
VCGAEPHWSLKSARCWRGYVIAGNYDTDTLIEVLGELRRFLGGEKATLVWDGLPAHRSTAMGPHLAYSFLRRTACRMAQHLVAGAGREGDRVAVMLLRPSRLDRRAQLTRRSRG